MSAISPKSSLSAGAGAGSRAGRSSTRPSVAAKLRLVTGSGAAGFSGPGELVGEEGVMDRADHVVDRDPAHPLAPAAERSARAEEEGRQHPRERAAGGSEHDAESRIHHPDAGRARGLGRALPVASQLDEEVAGGPSGSASSVSISSPRLP